MSTSQKQDAAAELVPAPVAAAGDPPAAGPLTPVDLQRVAEIKAAVDVRDAQAVLAYGLPAQSRIANFAN